MGEAENTTEIKILTNRVEVLERESKENRQSHAGIYDKIKAVDDKTEDYAKEFNNKLENTSRETVILGTSYKHVLEKLDKIDKKVDDLSSKPSRRYETVITGAISAIVGGIIVFLLAGMLNSASSEQLGQTAVHADPIPYTLTVE